MTQAAPRSRPVAGLPIRVTNPADAAQWVCETATGRSGEAIDVHLVNAYTVAVADKDPDFRALLRNAEANFPDGRPLAWVTSRSADPLTQVRGPDLFSNVMDQGREFGVRHFLLGTTDETLGLLRTELERRYPGVQIAGSYSPPFRALTEAEVAEQDALIRASGAHITWVGLGTPKQDFEAQRLARVLPGMAIAVGAAFDFIAGTKKEAPAWMTKSGLEWIYRLASEPRRLWRRYLVGNAVFLRSVIVRRKPR